MKKFGVVGVGYLGRFHGQKYALLKDRCELVGVFDQSFERAQTVATELGAKAFSQVDELLAAVDAVNVVCSTKGHFEVALRALELGKDVFVEKPITHSVETASKLVEFAKKQNKILQVGHIERFNPAFQEALSKFKDSRFVQADRIAPFNTRGSDVSVVYDLMIHDVDLVLSMVNSPVKSIKSLGARVLTEQVDMARAFIEFESGAFAEITTSRVAETPVRRIQAFNRNSYLDIDLGAVKYRLATKTDAHNPQNPKIPAESVQLQKGDALLEEVRSFITCVESRKQPVVDGASALKALQVCETIEKQMIFNS